ncbi:MAG: APC family permease, partial [Candidatus Micrarchaeota archaeon]
IFGAGIYALIGEAAATAGNGLWLSFALAAIIASFTGLSYAELSSMYPDAGAEYEYTKRPFGRRLGFIVGWLVIASAVISSATVALGFGGYFVKLFGGEIVYAGIGLIAALTFLLIWGIKQSAWIACIFTLIEASGLFIIIAIGMPHFGSVNYLELPLGFGGVFVASALIFFAFLGFEDMVKMAEEVKKPEKTVPRALIIAMILAAIVYILVAVSAVSVLGWEKLAASPAPLAYVAAVSFGSSAFVLLSMIALFATANTILMMMLAGSRIIYDMAKDRMFPAVFSLVSKNRRTPVYATIAIAVLCALFVLFRDISLVANLTNFTVFVTFILINATVIILRRRNPKAKRPFKSPSIGPVPVMAWMGLFTTAFLALNLDMTAVSLGIVVVAAGLIFYHFICGKSR